MHELGITQEIVTIVADRAGERRVRRVELIVGKLTAVLPDAIQFCWALCTEDTPLAGSILQIVEVVGKARCRECELQFNLDTPYGRCECGSTDLEWLEGEELRIREVEFV